MTLLVGFGVDIDLDEAHVRVVKVLLGPLGADECGLVGIVAHRDDLLLTWLRVTFMRPSRSLELRGYSAPSPLVQSN